MAAPDGVAQREVTAAPSSGRIALLKQRYLDAPLMVDIEYPRLLTESHKLTDGLEAFERRAEDHAHALEGLTPVIHPHDRIAGNKTRYTRGAIPYPNYAAAAFLDEMGGAAPDDAAARVAVGEGGGIAEALHQAEDEGLEILSGKFMITPSGRRELVDICTYWKDRCLLAAGRRLWREDYPDAWFIEAGWHAGLFSAPHEPCPEGRMVLDYETALARGYRGLLDDIAGRLHDFQPAGVGDGRRLYFWRAARRVLEGALAYTGRHADEAERLAAEETDPARRAELLELASVCRRVPAEPARTFREALQSFWFTYLLGHIEGSHLGFSPGRLDLTLWPYFEADPTAGFDDAVELFQELFIKMTQMEYIAGMSWQGLGNGNLFQNVILGGMDGEGKPADNELSLAILEAQIHIGMTQPTLSVWYCDGLSDEFLLKAAECVKTGFGYPAFFNQRVYVEHETRTSHVPVETARRYAAMGGCTEPVLEGMSYGIVQAGFVNHGKLLELALADGVDPLTGERLFDPHPLATAEDLRASYIDKMHTAVRRWQRYWNYVMVAHRETVPLIFASVFTRDCLASGLSLDDGGALVNGSPTTLSSGLVDVANSLAAAKKLCDDDNACSLTELRAALADDWVGAEHLHKQALAAPKWGNDDDYVDDIFLDIFEDYCAWVRGQDNYLGRPYDPSMLAISTPVPFGAVCGAFPDGRRAHEPLADGVTSPAPGTDDHGPTAVIRSSAKVDHTRMRGGLLNLKFHPSALRGERGSRNLLALIATYFEGPGFHVQFNVVDSALLRDAQKHPERYRDLVVRVAGFSAYWVEMSKAVQDQIISRTEHGQ